MGSASLNISWSQAVAFVTLVSLSSVSCVGSRVFSGEGRLEQHALYVLPFLNGPTSSAPLACCSFACLSLWIQSALPPRMSVAEVCNGGCLSSPCSFCYSPTCRVQVKSQQQNRQGLTMGPLLLCGLQQWCQPCL